MIVRERPSAFRMLFVAKGTILPTILPQLIAVITLSSLTVMFDHWLTPHTPAIPVAALSLIGLTLSIFLGFRNNACYDRWWEARKLWGGLISQMRDLARNTVLLPDSSRRQILYYLLSFAHVINARLRQRSYTTEELVQLQEWLGESACQTMFTQHNQGQFLLNQIHQSLVQCLRAGELSDICYTQLNGHVNELSHVQTNCERILTTPIPFAYSVLLHRTAYMFCLLLPFALGNSLGFLSPLIIGLLAYTFFGLDALGNEMEEPFGTLPNDLPLDAMLRLIEMDLLNALGDKELPEPLKPINYVLL